MTTMNARNGAPLDILPYSSASRPSEATMRPERAVQAHDLTADGQRVNQSGGSWRISEIAAKPRTDHRFSVRIIGGRWRGRRIAIPHGTAVRPTPDRVRETVFNWLSGEIPGAACLDLFAGTGVFGLEALSRGAREAWFVERDAELARVLRARIEELHADGRVVQTDVEALLRQAPQRQFDVVFLDPPYQKALEPLLASMASWVTDSAHIYVERPRPRGDTPGLDKLAEALPGAELVKQSRAGAVVFGVLRYRRP